MDAIGQTTAIEVAKRELADLIDLLPHKSGTTGAARRIAFAVVDRLVVALSEPTTPAQPDERG